MNEISRFFRQRLAADTIPTDPTATRLQIATCALLLEVAHADEDYSAEEQQTIRRLVRERFGLSQGDADELIALAEEERRQSTDLFQFTRLIGDQFGRAEKLAILEEAWRVVYSDGHLEAHEDALLHKLCTLLGLKHHELIALKLRVKGPGPA